MKTAHDWGFSYGPSRDTANASSFGEDQNKPLAREGITAVPHNNNGLTKAKTKGRNVASPELL